VVHLQSKPKLSGVAKVGAEAHGGVGRNRAPTAHRGIFGIHVNFSRAFGGGFYFHPTSKDRSPGIPLRKRELSSMASVYTNSENALLIRQENSDIVFPPISAKDAEMDGAPGQYLVAGSIGAKTKLRRGWGSQL
jgi:hypothetical protein